MSRVKSKPIIQLYKVAFNHWERACRSMYCYRTGFLNMSPEQKLKMSEASKHMEQAKDLVTEVFAELIGKAVTLDVRLGEWDK